MRRPDFICVGAQKSGTSSLWQAFVDDPSFAMPATKEIHYFDKRQNYDKGEGWYFEHFADKSQDKITGDITPEYLFLPAVPEKIKALTPGVKILIILRNPVNRAYSQYKHHCTAGVENRPFQEALCEDSAPSPAEFLTCFHRPDYYKEKSLYHRQVERYLVLFPSSQVGVFLFEELFLQNKVEAWSMLYAFLNIEHVKAAPSIPHRNASLITTGAYDKVRAFPVSQFLYRVLPTRLRNALVSRMRRHMTKRFPKLEGNVKLNLMKQYFMSDVKALENLLSKDLSIWYSPDK